MQHSLAINKYYEFPVNDFISIQGIIEIKSSFIFRRWYHDSSPLWVIVEEYVYDSIVAGGHFGRAKKRFPR